jgi:hypothetical protein
MPRIFFVHTMHTKAESETILFLNIWVDFLVSLIIAIYHLSSDKMFSKLVKKLSNC